jgi:hypothetical protein
MKRRDYLGQMGVERKTILKFTLKEERERTA